MKNYMVFCGRHEYTAGGWDDFSNSFDTLEEAIADIDSHKDFLWTHVVSMSERRVVYRS